MRGENIGDVFSSNTLTQWYEGTRQTVELTFDIRKDVFTYRLEIEYSRQNDKKRIKTEKLYWNNQVFYSFDGQEAHLYRINRDSKLVEEGVKFPADWHRSVIPGIAERDDNHPLIRFRKELDKILIIQPIAPLAISDARGESRELSKYAENFAQWYRHVIQEYPEISLGATRQLKEVLPGFDLLRLKESGESRELTAKFLINEENRDLKFSELSDGQRQLIILYMIAESLRVGLYSTILIDEPNNFVTIREIQPLLFMLEDICDEQGCQVLLVSHHPSVVNKMAKGDELWFSRPSGSHVETRPFPPSDELLPAEVMARGWEYE